jgi:hypothetical protein
MTKDHTRWFEVFFSWLKSFERRSSWWWKHNDSFWCWNTLFVMRKCRDSCDTPFRTSESLKGLSDQEYRDPTSDRYHRSYWKSCKCHNSIVSQEIIGICHMSTYGNKRHIQIWTSVRKQQTQPNDPTKTRFRVCSRVGELDILLTVTHCKNISGLGVNVR